MDDARELEGLLRAVEPGWRFVKERTLSQAHRYLRDHDRRTAPSRGLPLRLSKSEAESCGCFPSAVFADAPSEMIFVSYPVDRRLRDRSLPQQLLHFWKLLYALRLPTGNASRVWHLMPSYLRGEIEIVLKSDKLVLADATDAELADSFAIDLLASARFGSESLEYRYPGLSNWPKWRAELCVSFNETEVFQSSRPTGAADPQPPAPEPEVPVEARTSGRDARRAYRFARRAESARRRGNWARSAILFTLASRACSTGSTKYRNDSKVAIREGLVERLGPIFHWDARTVVNWKRALHFLLVPAARGRWSPAAKALYDLQTIAVDLGGELYAVDPAGWASTFGRRPLLRKLTLSRLALLHQRLLKVKQHVGTAGLPPVELGGLQALLEPEIRTAELALRAAVEPIIHRVFEESGLRADDIVERIALPKIVDELLDLTVAQGFFRFGDLRDALARNQLKVPDLAGPGEFFFGDALLKANGGLGEELDGIYYPAEVYLRWFHRGSAVAFGTKLGRWVTRFVALPFGAAFMTVEFAKYIAHEFTAVAVYIAGVFDPPVEPETTAAHAGISVSMESLVVMVAFGFVYLGLIHSSALRGYASAGLAAVGGAMRWAFAELPSKVWNSAPLKAVRRNRFVRWFQRRLAVPTVGAGVAAIGATALDWTTDTELSVIAGTFALLALAVNTPAGQSAQERIEDASNWLWRQLRTNFVPGLLGWIVWIFRELLAGLDRLIYSIDEWFRFRDGQAKPSLALKVALSLIWFPVRYVLRFVIYLLVEPQINPIKHFPVVTVSHKLLLPMIPAISTATGIREAWIAGGMSGVPGIFGFLAWELKENWRLYAANRPAGLVPLSLGHHGESVRGLLRPGFHSGTVPKAYDAIRRALAKAEESGTVARLRKPQETLHQVDHAIRHFIERDLLAYLAATRAWAGVPLKCDAVHLGLQHIRIVISGDGASAELRLELVDSQVAGHCDDYAFLANATPEQRECWHRAVLGFWAMAAVPLQDERVHWADWVRFWEGKA